MPTVEALLREAWIQLERGGVVDARRDARLLLAEAALLTQAQIIANPQLEVNQSSVRRFFDMVVRRALREPVSRIRGAREFYGRSFGVTPAVLDPRPDTETLIEAALSLPPPQRILDLGTGSGILAVTLLAVWPAALGVAVDLSPDALAVAHDNAAQHGVLPRLTLLEGDWFAPVHGAFDLIVSNPPYIPHVEISSLAPEVRQHDPHLALDGGMDGLDPYRIIAASALTFMTPRAHVLVEIGAGQSVDVKTVFAAHGLACCGEWPDLGGHVRVLAFNKP